MKKILLSTIYFLACILSIRAQTLYGTTYAGGSEGGGTIIKFLPATNDLSVVKSFAPHAYGADNTNFIQATDGKLYAMTLQGGRYGAGVIFNYDPSTSAYTILRSFDFDNGDNPSGSLIQATDGKLYGMTGSGGTGGGVIFSFDPLSSTYTKLKDFNNADGTYPYSGSLLQAVDGKLYGMTSAGGSSGFGVIFSFDPSDSTYTKLKDFNNTDGATPYGSLIQASDGKLYGMTNAGGNSNAGVIFSYDLSTSTYTKLKDFDNTNGANPYGRLIQGNDGKLYGATNQGGTNGVGVIFFYDPSVSTYTKLKDLDPADGANPRGSLLLANDGKIYGTTERGGSIGEGVIFSLDTVAYNYTKVKEFDITNGSRPHGSLLQSSDGKLYGMTNQGGGYGFHSSDDGLSTVIGTGVIFSFDPASTTYTKLRDFGISEDGESPQDDLMQAENGKLYGFTYSGGGEPKYGSGYGVLFSVDPSTSAYTNLKKFDFDHGGNPVGKLVQGGNGKLYGLTTYGGLDPVGRAGVIYSFDPATSTYTMLKEFNDPGDGGLAEGGLILATDGKLYGMAFGHFGNIPNPGPGFIFSFDPSDSVYTKLKDFDFTNGAHPRGSLVQASDGKLYGMTPEGGGLDSGVIFSFDPLSSTYTKLKDLNNASGTIPFGHLIQATDGKLYGMTYLGGNKNAGVIFSFDPSASTYTKLYDFDSTNGANPSGSLMQASDGKLYGMANAGDGYGVIFSFDPATGSYTKLQDFNDVNGSYSASRSGFIELLESPLPVTLISFTGKNMGNNNQLSWKVANEQHLNYYELQRSIDGQNFKMVSQIKAAGNNNYTYNDPVAAAASSLNYYRLKSVDKDGKFKYSLVIKIRTGHTGFAVVNPNPFKNKLVVNVESSMQDKAAFIITDISGKQMYKTNKLLFAGTNVVEINETGTLSKGTYLLRIITSQQTQSIKVVKSD